MGCRFDFEIILVAVFLGAFITYLFMSSSAGGDGV